MEASGIRHSRRFGVMQTSSRRSILSRRINERFSTVDRGDCSCCVLGKERERGAGLYKRGFEEFEKLECVVGCMTAKGEPAMRRRGGRVVGDFVYV